MQVYRGSGGIATCIIHLVLDGGEQASSGSGRFNTGKEPLVLDKWVSPDSAVRIVTRLAPNDQGSVVRYLVG